MFKCNLCGKKLQTESALISHCRAKHVKSGEAEETTKDGRTVFKPIVDDIPPAPETQEVEEEPAGWPMRPTIDEIEDTSYPELQPQKIVIKSNLFGVIFAQCPACHRWVESQPFNVGSHAFSCCGVRYEIPPKAHAAAVADKGSVLVWTIE